MSNPPPSPSAPAGTPPPSTGAASAADPGPERLIPGLLLILTLVTFARVTRCDFINTDDDIYVYANERVTAGLSWANVAWAFTSFHASNWHPLTWLSLMLDSSLNQFLDIADHHARIFHLTNLLLHAASTLILYNLLRACTLAPWRAALATALFAAHPLRVESVAWISERKDVLSLCLGLLALRAYLPYVTRPSVGRYLLVMSLLALSLLAKPMLVTLPCVMLLMDLWPLRRATLFPAPTDMPDSPPDPRFPRKTLGFLLAEKVPLLLLAAGSCVVTFLAQKAGGAVKSAEDISVAQRLTNVPVSYAQYLLKSVWFSSLSIEYPYRADLPAAEVAGSIAVLLLITVLAILYLRSRPYLAVGWFWFLGTLVPVIGLVQVGNQPMADRYSYFPSIGLAIMVAWSLPTSPTRYVRWATVMGALAAVLCLAGFAVRQIGYWTDTVKLYQHAIRVTGGSFTVENNLGAEFNNRGDLASAAEHYGRAARLKPRSAIARNNYGFALANNGQISLAMDEYRAALAIDPNLAAAHNNLGAMLERQGDAAGAENHFRRAVELDPNEASSQNNLGWVLAQRGEVDRAIEHYERALKNRPKHADAHFNLGLALWNQGKYEAGLTHLQTAADLQPDSPTYQRTLAQVKAQMHQASPH